MSNKTFLLKTLMGTPITSCCCEHGYESFWRQAGA